MGNNAGGKREDIVAVQCTFEQIGIDISSMLLYVI